jgi:hypothetical protein
MQEEQEKVHVPMDLAQRLTGWHSSMHDPIYAVSSSGIAKHPVPREIFENALANIVRDIMHPAQTEHVEELREIQLQMQGVLGQVKNDAEIRESVARCMARTYWAMAWADEAEENHEEINLSGCDIFHIAPETPKRALEMAYKDLKCFEEHIGKGIVEIYEPYAKRMSAFDFGYEVASGMTGSGGGELSLDTPWGETPYYYDLTNEWIAE